MNLNEHVLYRAITKLKKFILDNPEYLKELECNVRDERNLGGDIWISKEYLLFNEKC